jgi:hypothetical protein
MFDVLLCYGLTANMIRAGYLALVGDFFLQAWAGCRRIGARAAAIPRWRSHSGATLRRASDITLRRLARVETYITSMT